MVPKNITLSVKEFLAKNHTQMLQLPLRSSDIFPCDFWLLPKLKSALKDAHFDSVKAVKTKSTKVLMALREKDFQHYFGQ